MVSPLAFFVYTVNLGGLGGKYLHHLRTAIAETSFEICQRPVQTVVQVPNAPLRLVGVDRGVFQCVNAPTVQAAVQQDFITRPPPARSGVLGYDVRSRGVPAFVHESLDQGETARARFPDAVPCSPSRTRL